MDQAEIDQRCTSEAEDQKPEKRCRRDVEGGYGETAASRRRGETGCRCARRATVRCRRRTAQEMGAMKSPLTAVSYEQPEGAVRAGDRWVAGGRR